MSKRILLIAAIVALSFTDLSQAQDCVPGDYCLAVSMTHLVTEATAAAGTTEYGMSCYTVPFSCTNKLMTRFLIQHPDPDVRVRCDPAPGRCFDSGSPNGEVLLCYPLDPSCITAAAPPPGPSEPYSLVGGLMGPRATP